jgi:hypothetical protein
VWAIREGRDAAAAVDKYLASNAGAAPAPAGHAVEGGIWQLADWAKLQGGRSGQLAAV